MASAPPPPPPPTHAALAAGSGRMIRRVLAAASPQERLAIVFHSVGPTTTERLPRPLPKHVLKKSDPFALLRRADLVEDAAVSDSDSDDDDDAHPDPAQEEEPAAAVGVHHLQGPAEEDIGNAIELGPGVAAPAAAADE